MEAWRSDPFDNDDAGDCTYELEEHTDDALLQRTLEAIRSTDAAGHVHEARASSPMTRYRPSSSERAIKSAGGYFVPTLAQGAQPESIVKAVLARKKRAVILNAVEPGEDFSFVRRMPGLEFVSLPGVADITPIMDLPKLRDLAAEGWGGALDFQRLPKLEWLLVHEAKRGILDSLRGGHPRLHHVEVSRFPDCDLRVFAKLKRLVWLEVSYAGQLSSLAGLEALAQSLKALALRNCGKLSSLAGLEKLDRITGLSVSTCNKLKDYGPIAKMKGLRHLALTATRRLDLSFLRGHPTLEVVELSGAMFSIRPDEVEILQGLPRLRLISARQSYVKRDGRWQQHKDLREDKALLDSREANYGR